ncbi:hypothetical protein BAUR9175_02976 [Brevibacterium aurantiacum]|uniref:Uncharacterized protein n=1 Tax=Brevibacterium aurantiacum TaxID=273384 RepID=A0A2H1K120_BREAU|nr:hypothetical protein BAUR9175_02976 [Brevibacterium aurantiacum]
MNGFVNRLERQILLSAANRSVFDIRPFDERSAATIAWILVLSIDAVKVFEVFPFRIFLFVGETIPEQIDDETERERNVC